MSDTQELLNRRMDYVREAIDETTLVSDPLTQFKTWLDEADKSGVEEPNAFSVATASSDGTPSVRMVLLRKLDEKGFYFYTNYHSRKGRELAQNQRVSLCFYWQKLDRQVRVEGTASQCSRDESLAYFRTRPRSSQIAAWASPQSQRLLDREALDALVKEAEQKFPEGTEVPLPPEWGGYCVQPYQVEFWQGRRSRLHDRVVYRKEGKAWVRERLAP